MSLIGNHLLMDIYTSTQPNLKDPIMMQSIVAMIVEELKIIPLGIQCYSLEEDGVLCSVLLNEGQMSIRTYPQYLYVALDFFIEPTFEYEKEFIRAIKKHLSAEKTKVTHIKRGDLGTLTDMKPRSKTTSGPIRKVKDTSSKVIRMLKRK